jgi:hypothetical protein
MEINWNDYLYGSQNATTPTTNRQVWNSQGPVNILTTDYGTLYNQAKSGNYSNFTANQTGFAPGSADWLAASARTNPSVMGTLNFNTLLNPEVANQEVVNTNRTFQTVREEAEADYLARATEYRDLARQGIQQTGADQYSQARMAMEQQRALSDTRGLTAGAAEGARQGLSATQQIALNQIEAQTQSELLNLKAQGIQDEFLAQEWADRKVEQFQTESPEVGELMTLRGLYQGAANRQDIDTMASLEPQIAALELSVFGVSEERTQELINIAETGSLQSLAKELQEEIKKITAEPESISRLANFGFIAGGGATTIIGIAKTVGAAKGIITAASAASGIFGSIAAGAGAVTVGAVAWPLAVAAGIAAIGWGLYKLYERNQLKASVSEKAEIVDELLGERRTELLEIGLTNEQIDLVFAEATKDENPIYRR